MIPKLLSTLLTLSLLLLTSAAPSYASALQNSDTSSETQEAVALQKALEELSGRRREVEALKAAIGARDERIKGLLEIIADQERITALWREAAEARANANATDDKIKASYEQSVKAYEVELARVRADRDAAKRQRWFFSGVALVLGAVLGVLATRD